MNDSQRAASRSEQRRLLLEKVGVEVGHAVVEGMTLRYACSAGEGEPLLFCNGIGANFELALPLVRELKGQPVVLFDLPGVGGSPSALVWPSFARYARLARALVDVLEVGGPFSVIGMSWGAGWRCTWRAAGRTACGAWC